MGLWFDFTPKSFKNPNFYRMSPRKTQQKVTCACNHAVTLHDFVLKISSWSKIATIALAIVAAFQPGGGGKDKGQILCALKRYFHRGLCHVITNIIRHMSMAAKVVEKCLCTLATKTQFLGGRSELMLRKTNSLLNCC